MYRIIVLLVILTLGGIEKTYADNSRIIVLSDIGGSDPDDQQSMVHLLTLLDRIDLEGIIYQHAWVSFNKGNEVTVGKAAVVCPPRASFIDPLRQNMIDPLR